MARFPLRMQLSIAYTAVVALALGAFVAVAFAAVHLSLSTALDQRLDTTTAAIRSVPDIHGNRIALDPDDREQMLRLLTDNHVDGAAVDANGTLLIANVSRPPVTVLRMAASSEKHTGTLQIGGDPVAYRSEPIWVNHHYYGSVVTWSSRAVADDAARSILTTLLGAALVLIVVVFAAGGALARRSLRPMSELSTLVSHIEAADLSERLDWQGADDEIGRLCATFDRLLDRLETAFDAQRRFTSDASHELRTPISVMRAEIELALGRQRDADAYRRALERLQAETTRLEALIESLLLTARGEAMTARTDLVALDDVARRVVDRLATPAVAGHVSLVVEPQPDARTRGDGPLLESATLALVDNAIRHTPGGGSVRVVVVADATTAGVIVRDAGRGFSDAALRDGTRRFWRDDTSRTGSHTGLGLAIARTIAEHHGGTLTLSNAPDGGAVAHLSFARAHDDVPAHVAIVAS